MSRLNELLERRRGKYKAVYGGRELGTLALPPEIRAGYDSEHFTIHALPSKKLEGYSEKRAEITLHLTNVAKGFELLAGDISEENKLLLSAVNEGSGVTLEFPEARLLPKWEFEPALNSDHTLVMHFYARCAAEGKLFYFMTT